MQSVPVQSRIQLGLTVYTEFGIRCQSTYPVDSALPQALSRRADASPADKPQAQAGRRPAVPSSDSDDSDTVAACAAHEAPARHRRAAKVRPMPQIVCVETVYVRSPALHGLQVRPFHVLGIGLWRHDKQVASRSREKQTVVNSRGRRVAALTQLASFEPVVNSRSRGVALTQLASVEPVLVERSLASAGWISSSEAHRRH